MIQDVFTALVPRITSKFKSLFYIANSEGEYLLNELGQMLQLPEDQNDFTLKIKYSAWNEWVSECTDDAGLVDANEIYPFIYINSVGVTQERQNGVVSIPQIVIAVNSDDIWKSAERDENSFKPILNNLYKFFYEAMYTSREFCVVEDGSRKDHYMYQVNRLTDNDGKEMTSHADVIEINNLQIRIFKNC